jgi:hypothetical protein
MKVCKYNYKEVFTKFPSVVASQSPTKRLSTNSGFQAILIQSKYDHRPVRNFSDISKIVKDIVALQPDFH